MAWQTLGICECSRYLALATLCVMMQDPTRLYAQSFPARASDTESLGDPHAKVLPVLRLVKPLDEQVTDKSPTKIIPSLRLATRYDSNVYFVPGVDLEDYVTAMTPKLNLTHKTQWMDALVGGGATGEVYTKNPGLSYVGGNANVDLNLDGAVNQLVRGLGLRVSDAVVYTPQPLAFAQAGGSQLSQAFVQGLQPGRVNTLSNTAQVDASYFFSPLMGVSVTYMDQRIRFGSSFSAPTGASQERLINTSFQTLTSGLVGKPSPSDTVLLAHQYQKGTFSNLQSDGEDGGFSAQGAIARWSRSITPALRATIEGGFSVISPTSAVRPVAVASLRWDGQYTTVELSYARTVAPSFLFASTPLLSQAVTGMVKHKITEPLSVSLTGNYAINKSVPDSSLIRFESYSVSPSLEYRISQNLTAMLSYTHSEFQRAVSEKSFDFERKMVVLSLLAEWR